MCNPNEHHFVDLKHFTGGSECHCCKCDLVETFNRGYPERIDPNDAKAFLETYKNCQIDFLEDLLSKSGMKNIPI